MKRIISLAAALFLLLSITAFANTATFENGGDNRFKSIRLTPEIYNHSNMNLSDLRIRDELGEYVPFFIHNHAETPRDEGYFVEEFAPSFSVEETERRTLIHIKDLRNIRLSSITIDTDSVFQRTVRSPFLNPQELYNLTFNDATHSNTTLQYFGQTPDGEIFTLSIYNGDDRPININGIAVRYYTDELVFEGGGSAYFTLHFSGERSLQAPVYDIARRRSEILRGEIDGLELREIVFAEPIELEPLPERDFTMIFNIAVIAVAILLALLILLKLKKKS